MSRNIIRKPAVRQKTGLSDTTIWRLQKAGEFPPRVQLTDAGLVGWFEDEVDRWVHERVRAGGKRPPRADRRGAAA
jgi:prophage regulatory protein